MDQIPIALSIPLRLLEFRPCWELHALLRINRIQYRADGLELPFSMDRPLPLLVHGNHVYASRSCVFEYVAGYKPMASQSTATVVMGPESVTPASPIPLCAEEGTLNIAFVEKLDGILQLWRKFRGFDRDELWQSLPLLHSAILNLCSDIALQFSNTSPSWVLPDTSDAELLVKLDCAYAGLDAYFSGLYQRHSFVGPMDSTAYASTGSGSGIVNDGSTLPPLASGGGGGGGRRGSLLLPATAATTNAQVAAYGPSDAVLFSHILAGLFHPETKALLDQRPALMAYFKVFTQRYFSNASPAVGDSASKVFGAPFNADEKDCWNTATVALLDGNPFCQPKQRRETLEALLGFDYAKAVAAAEQRRALMTDEEKDLASGLYCSNHAKWVPLKLSTAGSLYWGFVISAVIAGATIAIIRSR